MKIKLEMDVKRAEYLLRACEIMARIGMCQFKDMVELLTKDYSWDLADEIEKYLKNKLAPNLGYNASYGIRMDEVPEECHIAWDCYQHLRREISWHKKGKDWRTDERDWTGPDKMMGVHYDNPMKASRTPGDFKTERVEDEKA